MTTFAVISDIHGCSIALEKVFEHCQNKFNVDYYLLLGDLLYHGPRNRLVDGYDAKKTAELLNCVKSKIIAVRGNCDAEVDQVVLEFPIIAAYNQLLINDRRVFMTHGHLYQPEDLPLSKGDIFIQGHTHKVVLEQNNLGIILFNPGSISLPRQPEFGTFGIINNSIELVSVESGKTVNSLSLY